MSSPRSGPLPARIGVLIAALAFVGASCGPPAYDYLRNTTARTAFKLPRDWQVFDKQEFLGLGNQPTSGTPDPIRWLVAFDGSPTPSIDHVLNNNGLDTPYPQGIALVYRLGLDVRDAINLNTMRNFLFPIDYFQQDDISVFGYSDHVSLDDNQIRGVHIDFEFRQAALPGAEAALASASGSSGGSPPEAHPFPVGAGSSVLSSGFVHVDQYVYVDSQVDTLYLFVVMCSADCYQRNAGAIHTAADSWTVLP